MDCEICGKQTADLFLISIDGVRMGVCQRCSHHGSFIKKVEEPPAAREIRVMTEGPENEVRDDYAATISNARRAKAWEQKDLAQRANEALGVIKKIEQGKLAPTDKLAKRLETLLGIRLMQTVKKESLAGGEERKNEGSGLTLGDTVVVKKRERIKTGAD